jgi:LSD1 subclass zinc finger protein
MDFFKKLAELGSNQPLNIPQSATASAGLPRPGDALPESLKAHSQFIKRVSCTRCGAPKSLPSATAYLYCDYCGSLIDYDFRIANADTNAGLTNTVFHRLMAGVQAQMTYAKSRGDRETCRALYRQLFAEWLKECPMAASPRAKTDMAFRDRFVAYSAECAVTKDFDPHQVGMDAQMQALTAALQRIPTPGGAWRVAGGFWPYAEMHKRQMELTYDRIHAKGVDDMDPDQAPPGVPLRMEFSTFCQAWLPHLSPEEGERLLVLYGLNAEYDAVRPQVTHTNQCGACGTQIQTIEGARQVVCEACGHTLDIAGGAVPCRSCGKLLSFPVGVSRVQCPNCSATTSRV